MAKPKSDIDSPARAYAPLTMNEDKKPEQPPRSQSAYLDRHGRLITRCLVCGSPDAPFGVGVRMLKGILGEYYCRNCLPSKERNW